MFLAGTRLLVAAAMALLSLSCEERRVAGTEEPAVAADSADLTQQIEQFSTALGYSKDFASDFAAMVTAWKDDRGKGAIREWEKTLAQAKRDQQDGKRPSKALVRAEEQVVSALAQKVKTEFAYSEQSFELESALKHKRAQCVVYSQIVCMLGKSIGLSIQAISVLEPWTGTQHPEWGHTANLVSLVDGTSMMVDLVPGGFVSEPFNLVDQYEADDGFLKLKHADNPLHIHRRVRRLDRQGLLAATYQNRGLAFDGVGQHKEALQNHSKAIGLDPNAAALLSNRSGTYIELGRLPDALSDLKKAVELDRQLPSTWSNLGGVYHRLKHFDDAVSAYDTAIRLDSAFAEAYGNRAITYRMMGRISKAIADDTEAIRLDPGFAKAYYNRAICYEELGKLDEAVVDLSKAIELEHKLISYNRRADVYHKLGKFRLAVADITRTIELDGQDALAYNRRGVVYRDLKEYDRALLDYDRALAIDPRHAEFYYNRGVVHSDLGRFRNAISDYGKAIGLDSQRASAHFNRANAYLDLDELENSVAGYTKTIAVDSNHSGAYANRGVVYAMQGKKEEARKDLLKAVELKPSLKNLVKRVSDRFKLGLGVR